MKPLCTVNDIKPLLKASGLTLRQHQIAGIEAILKWINNKHGGILADEMGLGKTCQAVIALVLIAKTLPDAKFLIICPLSVIEHWENELMRFGCGILKIFTYKGYKESREKLRHRFSSNDWNVCLTTYTYFRIDNDIFTFPIEVAVVDEAHSVKSQNSQLHNCCKNKNARFYLLLTGTPIQNDLNEFYSLLSLADNDNFGESETEREKFLGLPRNQLEKKLKEATEKYVLRRLKTEVCSELPTSQEVILLHSLTNFQKQLYNAVLVSNHGFFEGNTSRHLSLMNVLIQLRKAVAHPYLFPGIEPEPFEEGEHLITASGKFMVVDKLLSFLKASNHRCLIFSQYSRNLEILADAMSFRGYKYEHLDGSSKPEDRFQSIENFQKPDSDVFCFLISTKAGGQGLTLTAADTVIFLDSDFNPQNDLQAAARCHRIGQDKPVKVIRLLAEHTIDNAIRKRAEGKLKLSEYILDDSASLSTNDLKEILLSDLTELNKVPDCTEAYTDLLTDEYFVSQIGKTDENGHWINEVFEKSGKKVDESGEVDFFPRTNPITMLSKDDENTFDKLKAELSNSDTVITRAVKTAPTSSKNASNSDAEEKREQRRAAAKAKREEQERKREEAKMELWKENNYVSNNLAEIRTTQIVQIGSEPTGRLFRVFGSVGNPLRSESDASKEAWILHSVDSGGRWGRGGIFSVLDSLSFDVSDAYEKAGKVQDLHCGDVHLVEGIIDERESESVTIQPELSLDEDNVKKDAAKKLLQKVSVLLMVGQTLRDRHRMVFNESALKRCFKAIADFALTRDELPSIHMGIFWYGIPTLNERAVCNLIVKEFCRRGLDVYIYHYARHGSRKGVTQPHNLALKSPRKSSSQNGAPPAKKPRLAVAVVDDDDDEATEESEAELTESEADDESEEEESEVSETEEEESEMDLDLTESEEEDSPDDGDDD